ncbi:MAG: VOC family protein [Planctomycetes bacterium]|nr:VOC family protein [Planctomycetota bacterium]
MAKKKTRKAPARSAKKSPAKKAKRKSPAKAASAPPEPKPKHGAFMWNELMTRDDERALTFFEKLLGWTHQDWPMGPGQAPYRIAKVGEKSVAGILKMTEPQFPAQVPTHWCGYIAVRSVDDAWQQVLELGGERIHPPSDIPEVGRFCIIKDPTGAVVALMTPSCGVE